MVKPLPAGKHTLGFKGKLAAVKGLDAFEVDVAYELTVVDKPKK